MMEWIKCNHLTDRWEQFKSIPTLTEYELGNLLFCYSVLFFALSSLFSTTWKNFFYRLFLLCCPSKSPHPPNKHHLLTKKVHTLFALFQLVEAISERESEKIIRILHASYRNFYSYRKVIHIVFVIFFVYSIHAENNYRQRNSRNRMMFNKF